MINQDEINLINFFTHNKNLTRAQRERFASLVARDMDGFKPSNISNDMGNLQEFETNDEMRDVFSNIEHSREITMSENYEDYSSELKIMVSNENVTKLGFNNSVKKNPLRSKKEDLPKYISPKKLQSFLEQYNQNPILKYTCHSIDDKEVIEELCQRCNVKTYKYEAHVQLIINEFDALLKSFQNEPISENMIALISAYLKGKKEWSSDNIPINWSCKEIKEWAKDNPGIIPNPGPNIANEQKNRGFRLNHFTSKLTNESISRFDDLCKLFKSLFHIRRDNSLKKLITNKIDDININFSETNFRENIELFTDVDKLIQAITRIVRICKDCDSNNPNIEISCYTEEDNICIAIHHKNSKYGKPIKETVRRIGEKHSLLIKNQLNGLADLYIEADFDNNEFAQVNLWNGKPRKEEIMTEVEGVKYILKF